MGYFRITTGKLPILIMQTEIIIVEHKIFAIKTILFIGVYEIQPLATMVAKGNSDVIDNTTQHTFTENATYRIFRPISRGFFHQKMWVRLIN